MHSVDLDPLTIEVAESAHIGSVLMVAIATDDDLNDDVTYEMISKLRNQ